MPVKGLPDKLDTAKLIEFLKSCHSDMTDVPDRRYMYLLGRTTLVDILLVAIYCGEFDPPQDDAINSNL